MDFTVDDILNSRRSLKERAIAAHQAALDAKQAEREDERDRIEAEVMDFLRTEFGLTPPELADLSFERGGYSSERQAVWFSIDGLKFRGRFGLKQQAKIESYQFNDTKTIYEEYLIVEVQKDQKTWTVVDSLASLGKALQ